jgi:glycerol-3-phosphate acyltransferase PlsY
MQELSYLLNSWFKLPTIVVIAYLLGSVNTSIIVARLVKNKDIRDYGSGNAGFTNAVRSMGTGLGMVVLAGDVLKCVIAILLGQLIYIGDLSFNAGAAGRLLAGCGVFLGHIYPIWFRFRGGKGALTAATTIALFDWRIFLIVMAVFLVAVLISKYISLGTICGAIAFPIVVLLFSRTSISAQDMAFGYSLVSAGIAGLVIFKHRSNIVRILSGTESKFYFRKKGLMDEEQK